MKELLLSILCSVTICSSTHAQEPTFRVIKSDNTFKGVIDTAVDRCVQSYFKDTLATGLSVGIIKAGKIFQYNYGQVQKGQEQLPTATTLYEIGSVTKTFTGILLAQAVLDKKIKLEEDIRKYLTGSYPNLQYKDTPIQVVHLSNHTSRLPTNANNLGKQQPFDPSNPFAYYTAELFNEELHSVIIDTLPGTRQSYSNMGVALLGKIISGQYNLSYINIIRRLILLPTLMTDTRLALEPEDINRLAKGYDLKGAFTSYYDCGEFLPAGGIRSTLRDMLRYIKFNLSDNPAVKLSHDRTFGTNQNGTALGWQIAEPQKNITSFWHGGGTGGFTSMCVVIPAKQSGFVILSNSKVDLTSLTGDLTNLLTR